MQMQAQVQTLVQVVLGAGGPTGSECVKRLLAVPGNTVRAVVRDPKKYEGEAAPWGKAEGLQVVAGDVTDPSSLTAALQGAENVIIASSGATFWSAKSVDNQGVANVAAAAKAAGVNRVVLVSSMLVTPQNRFHPIRIILNNIRWSLMDNKFAGENALRASGVPYTVVRPGGLTKAPAGQAELMAGQGDKMQGAGSISRADVAAVCVSALGNPPARNVTLEVASRKGAPAPAAETLDAQLKRLWQEVKPDGAAAAQ